MNEQEQKDFKDDIFKQLNEVMVDHFKKMDKWEVGAVKNIQQNVLELLPAVLSKTNPSFVYTIFMNIINGFAVGFGVYIALRIYFG
jgi:hypothetical protein